MDHMKFAVKTLSAGFLSVLLAMSTHVVDAIADDVSSQQQAVQPVQGAQLLWDYHGITRDKKPIQLLPLAGAILPDESIILTALWEEGTGAYRAYKVSKEGQLVWQYRVLEDPIDGVEAWPGMVPLLRPRPGGADVYGYIATGRLIGPRYFTDAGGHRPSPEWRGPPPEPFTALASSNDGRTTVGGSEAEPFNRSPLAPCTRALVVRLDSNDREMWRWHFRAEHKASFVRSLQYLADGSTLVFIDDKSTYGSRIDGCVGSGNQRWLVWLDSSGRDLRTILLSDDAQWVTALSDGRIVTLRTEDWLEAYWEINWHTYAADGSKLLSTKAIDLNPADLGNTKSPESALRRDVPSIKGLWLGHGRVYLAVQWSGFEAKREYESRLAVLAEDGELLGLSAAFHWRSLYLGPTADESEFVVAAPDGLYRVPMP